MRRQAPTKLHHARTNFQAAGRAAAVSSRTRRRPFEIHNSLLLPFSRRLGNLLNDSDNQTKRFLPRAAPVITRCRALHNPRYFEKPGRPLPGKERAGRASSSPSYMLPPKAFSMRLSLSPIATPALLTRSCPLKFRARTHPGKGCARAGRVKANSTNNSGIQQCRRVDSGLGKIPCGFAASQEVSLQRAAPQRARHRPVAARLRGSNERNSGDAAGACPRRFEDVL